MSVSTRDRVFEAADALLREGVKPSQQSVRERIGKGSATTIHKALGEWWAMLSARIDQRRDHAQVPEFLDQALVDIWQEAMARARSHLADEEKHMRSTLLSKQQALDEALSVATQRSEQLGGQLGEAYRRIETLQQQLDDSRREVLELERKLMHESARVAELERQDKTQQKVIARLEQQNGAAADPPAMASPAETDHQIQQENANLKSTIARLDGRLAETEQQLKLSQDALLDAKRRYYRLESGAEGAATSREAEYRGRLEAKEQEITRLLALLADKG